MEDFMKKKTLAVAGIGVVLAVAVTTSVLIYQSRKRDNDANNVFVSSVGTITGNIATGWNNRFSGVVEPQETKEVKLDTSKKVKELFVEAGDTVTVGTPLFQYETDELALNIQQGQLEGEQIKNEMASTSTQIAALEAEKAKASADAQLSYTVQIQTLQTELKKQQYNINTKQLEMEQLQKSIDNAIVTSEMDGVIKKINEKPTSSLEGTGSDAYITILATGEFRIKGTISEMNIYEIGEGKSVIVRSRVDEDKTWAGTISKIDRESQESSNNNSLTGNGAMGSAGSSSKYSFYVALSNTDDLMLGQHVFIELDEGISEQKEGLWIGEYYIVQNEEGDSFVWIDQEGKIEKRQVQLGEYDENLGEYEIIDGLTIDDYIAFPDDTLKEGNKTVRVDEQEGLGGI